MEIEDVLSSIRRLVSEDSRSKRPSAPRPVAQPDRLVLTPAQRVSQESEAEAAQPAPAEPVLLTNPTMPGDSEPAAAEAAVLPVEPVDEAVMDADFGVAAAEARLNGGASVGLDAADADQDETDLDETAPLMAFARSLAEAGREAEEPEVAEADVPDEPTGRPRLEAMIASVRQAGQRPVTLDFTDDEPETEAVTASSILSQLVEREVTRVLAETVEDESAALDEDPHDHAEAEDLSDALDAFEPGDLEALMAEDSMGGEDGAGIVAFEPTKTGALGGLRDRPLTLEDKIAALEKLVGKSVAVTTGPDTADTVQAPQEQAGADAAMDAPEAEAPLSAADAAPLVDPVETPEPETVDAPDAETMTAEAVTEFDTLDDVPDAADAEAAAEPVQTAEPETAEQLRSAAMDDASASHEPEVREAPTFVHRPARALDWQDYGEETYAAGIYADASVGATSLADTYSASREDALAALDEASLRLMVSEIVRQELQGALGERITRNVRKLVRREIHRAIMSQEFD